MIGYDELKNRFTYHPPPDAARVAAHEEIRKQGLRMALYVDNAIPDSREKSLAITALEDAVMWANAGLARHGRVPETE